MLISYKENKSRLKYIHIYIHIYIQINTWAFPYWPGYHPDGVCGQYGSRDDNQANMEMAMY
jgi:hypothetical protein